MAQQATQDIGDKRDWRTAVREGLAPDELTQPGQWLTQMRLCALAAAALGISGAALVALAVEAPSLWLLLSAGGLCTAAVAALLAERYVLLPMVARQQAVEAEHEAQRQSLAVTRRIDANRSAETLKALVEDNQRLQEGADADRRRADAASGLLEAMVEATSDAVLLTNPAGVVCAMTESATTVLGVYRSAALSQAFDAVVKLYEPNRDSPTEYPIRNLVQHVVEARSAIPSIVPALLEDAGTLKPVLLTTRAVRSAEGAVTGVAVRIELTAAHEAAASAKPGQRDPSTDLPGRGVLLRRLEELLQIAAAQDANHVLLLAALDGLSEISAHHGCEAVDQTLWQVARELQQEVGTHGDCYRAGTDHFAVLLPFMDDIQAKQLAERLRDRVAVTELRLAGDVFQTTISVSITPFGAQAERSGVLAQADHSLIHARALGGNSVRVAGQEQADTERHRSDRTWIEWLLPRLEDGRMHLISQEIRPLREDGGRQPMFESLVRVEDDDGVWILPGQFLPAVIHHNLTTRIDEAVFARLLHNLRTDVALVEHHALASMNLSGGSLLDEEFCSRVAATLRADRRLAARICFEIDEQFAASHLREVEHFVQEMHSAGARCALDRCRSIVPPEGLRRLPLYMVKIDGAMVRRALSSPMDRAQLQWIVQANRMLERLTVAVGVESAEILEALRDIGVDYVQGIHVNKMGPMIS